MWWFLKRVCTVLWMIIVYQVLPTFDQFSDIKLGIAWASTRPPWALAILCIYIMHVLFTSFLWYHLEPRSRKKFTWIFVIFACYPQYRAAIMIKDTALNNEEKLKKETEIYDKYLSCLEAFVEAIPQVIVYTASLLPYLGTFTGRVDDSENLGLVACGVPDNTEFSPNAGYHARWFKTCFSFKLKYVISFITASYGTTKFYKLSPMKFISNKGENSKKFYIMYSNSHFVPLRPSEWTFYTNLFILLFWKHMFYVLEICNVSLYDHKHSKFNSMDKS